VTAQNMGRRILTDAGYEVITVNNGSAALKKIAELLPDLIVLDVYMPGYGGLEVCQRLKESQATSRIPVLLTVGKLEPFKAEEARRVRADGHIVKPFDATELLAAIMRLEDRIVPQPASSRAGRSGKANAAGEEASSRRGRDRSVDPTTETSSGWKKRLSIPRPVPTPEVEREEKPGTAGTAFQDLSRGSDSKPQEAKLPEPPSPPIVSLNPGPDEKGPISAGSFEKVADAAPAEEASRPGREAMQNPAIPEMAVESETISLASLPSAGADTTRRDESPSGAEVMAALASLPDVSSAISENARRSAESSADGYAKADLPKRVDTAGETAFTALGAALAAVSTVLAGPRWTAERVPLSDGDSHLILEAEMEKAYAAFAAAESARTAPPAMAPEAEPPVHAASIPIASMEDFVESQLASASVHETAVSSPEVKGEEHSATPDVPVPEGTSSVEPVPAVATELVSEALRDAVANSVVELQAAGTERIDTVATESVASTGYRDIACAAAASASSGSGEMTRTAFALPAGDPSGSREIQVAPEPGGNLPVQTELQPEAASQPVLEAASSSAEASDSHPTMASDTGDPERESQLVAAWQNWRQIRESIVGEQLPSQIADAAAASFKQIRTEENEQKAGPSDTDAGSLAASRAVAEASAIAGIVDSVLSELKPKLMEEIARKLAEDRK
jgi:CheY-like chemotaxis protein